jgi:cell division protein ZapA
MVDEKAREAGGGSPGLNETRSLLFSALLLADRLHDVSSGAPVVADNAQTSEKSSQIAEALEGLASRLENLAEKLEN